MDADDTPAGSRTQYAMYLSDGLQERLDGRFAKMNALRVLDDQPELEKHSDFLEAVVMSGLESDELEDYIQREVESGSAD